MTFIHMPIYTKTGDKGTTGLYGGKRVSKFNIRVETYGTVDELNSAIGVAIAEISKIKNKIAKTREELIRIQNDLFSIGSALASTSAIPNTKLKKRVEEFEVFIDQMTAKMPVLSNFILPGGGKVGAELHLARTICRRAERRVVELSKTEKIDENILMYFNRLSDLLFTMARFVNSKQKRKETIWKK